MNAEDVYRVARKHCQHMEAGFAPCRNCLADTVREYHESQLRLGLGEPPVSEERVAEIRSEWDESKVAMPRSIVDLLAIVDHYRLLVAALARDNPDMAEVYRDGLRKGLSEGKQRCIERLECKMMEYGSDDFRQWHVDSLGDAIHYLKDVSEEI